MTFSKNELVRYRIQRAEEAFKDGQLLAEEGRWNAAANRLYYSCFYIVSAYLVLKGIKSSTHSGLKSAFNQELVKAGKIDKSEGLLFNKLFSIRQQIDYEDFVDISNQELSPLIPKIKQLIDDIKKLISTDTDA
ncbi:MAG: HEPN domain-containing protein [Saprospiraceae bacterium]